MKTTQKKLKLKKGVKNFIMWLVFNIILDNILILFTTDIIELFILAMIFNMIAIICYEEGTR